MIDRRGMLGGLAALLAARVTAAVAADDPRLRTTTQAWKVGGERRFMAGYFALPARARGRQPAVLLFHDRSGLTETIRDAARRVALEGFIAIAPDFLTPGTGTPPNDDAARLALAVRDPAGTLYDAQMTLYWLRWHRYTTGRVGAVGFGWGGALVERLAAVSPSDLAAAVAFGVPEPTTAAAPACLTFPAPDPDEASWARTVTFLKEHLA